MSTSAFAGLVDDAAIFPPGNLPLPEAVRAHREHRGAWYVDLVGPFLCSDTRLPELIGVLEGEDRQLELGVVVSGGAGSIQPALTWCAREPQVVVRAAEVALRDEPDLPRNVQRMMAMLDLLPDPAMVAVEVPRLYDAPPSPGWLGALDAIAAAGYRLKYRTGGPDPQAFPSDAEFAHVIAAALDRELAIKCTAGLHHAVRHTAAGTGFEEHGFLNVLLATRTCLDGAETEEVATVLGERDPEAVAEQVRKLGDDGVTATRRWFTSFGSCSIVEPVAELLSLGLVTRED